MTTLTVNSKPARRSNPSKAIPSATKAAYADYRETLEAESEGSEFWAETYWYLVGAQR